MSPKPPISSEDSALFRDTLRDVTPLSHKKPLVSPEKNKPPATRRHKEPTPLLNNYDLSDYYANPVQAESMLNYRSDGVSSRQVQKFTSGKQRYEAKLDLHGFKPEDAKHRLSHFIQAQIQYNHRWVLIIHGKGGRFGETPVLKNLVNQWLRQIPDILAFQSALPKHGGTGAVYVLLRKIIDK
ncbi:MAG: Smr/MutS family protein [Gammaproteobacteria bacterium]|nr:Smr/MutS family protein [Gammaproteobacteria bacterium]